VGKYAPAALGRAIAGAADNTLHTPALGAALLALYGGAALAAGMSATARRDFA
jgi:hypothetical protein